MTMPCGCLHAMTNGARFLIGLSAMFAVLAVALAAPVLLFVAAMLAVLAVGTSLT